MGGIPVFALLYHGAPEYYLVATVDPGSALSGDLALQALRC